MTRYFRNKLDNSIAHHDRQDLIEMRLTETYQVGTEMVEIDGTMVEQPIYEKIWEEITKEQADALNPPMEEPSADEIAKQQRIAELKQKLADTDYLNHKHYEGKLDTATWLIWCDRREQWRKEINDLEGSAEVTNET